jgi:hypothetical protein
MQGHTLLGPLERANLNHWTNSANAVSGIYHHQNPLGSIYIWMHRVMQIATVSIALLCRQTLFPTNEVATTACFEKSVRSSGPAFTYT